MKICAEFVVRVAGSDTLSPLEKASVVSEGGEEALHKDGGYYVFVRPIRKGSAVRISAVGYEPCQTLFSGQRLAVVYAKSSTNPPRSVSFFAAAPAKKGERTVAAAFVGEDPPQIADGCVMRHGGNEYAVAGYDAASGIITADRPLSADIRQGDELKLSAG